MSRLARFTLALVALVALAHAAAATECNTSCDNRCQRCLAGICLLEPSCLVTCEVERNLACAFHTPIPHVPTPGDFAHDPQQLCAPAFEVIANPVIAYCANWPGRAEELEYVEAAKSLLVRAGIFTAGDFNGVDIRWCPLSNGSGMAPGPGRILLHDNLKRNLYGLTKVLAHEMRHKQQWERWGDIGFKCRYGAEMVKGHGQGTANSVEAEAYGFEDEVGRILSEKWADLIGQHPENLPGGAPRAAFDCASRSSGDSVCQVQTESEGLYYIFATARVGDGAPDAWADVRITVNDQSCGYRQEMFSNGATAIDANCLFYLKAPGAYTVSARSTNRHATGWGIMLGLSEPCDPGFQRVDGVCIK